MNKLLALRQRVHDLKEEASTILAAVDVKVGFTPEQKAKLDELKALKEKAEADVQTYEAMATIDQPVAAGDGARAGASNASKKPWGSLAEMLRAVYNFYSSTGRVVDERLYGNLDEGKSIYAALGANESVPAEGGFLVTPEYATGLLKKTYDVGLLSSRCFKMPMASTRLIMHAVDEDSRKDGSRWGGILAYWLAEAGTYSPTKPKFREMQLVANKLIALSYATEEQLVDGPAWEAYVSEAVPQELSFQIDTAIFSGSGAGQPLGLVNSGALVTVAKESGQTAQTIVTNNILKMWQHMFARSRTNAVWLINQDVEAQLYPLTMGSPSLAQILMFTPPGMLGNPGPYGLMMGRPVIPIEQASTLGTAGDITLCDMSQYLLAQRSDVRADTSIHVAFLTGEQAFRFMLRLDGQPMWRKPLTPYQGSNLLSPFIMLATRS